MEARADVYEFAKHEQANVHYSAQSIQHTQVNLDDEEEEEEEESKEENKRDVKMIDRFK